MRFIVEDGTRPDGANTYASIADADAYLGARGNVDWVDAATKVKESSLLRATQWLNGRPWFGRKVAPGTMAWPRYDVVDADGHLIGSGEVPPAIVDACCELAGIIVSGGDPLEQQGQAMSAISVGPISISYQAGTDGKQSYPSVNVLLRGFVMSSNSIRLVRG